MYNKKFSKEPTEKQKIGQIGEDCACEYLEKEEYIILERNYNRKWGELDIVAKKSARLHFIEVKAVSSHISDGRESDVTRETSRDAYRPEDNMHPWKLKRLARAVQSYLLERDISDNVDWQFDLITVQVDMEKRLGRVLLIPDIVL